MTWSDFWRGSAQHVISEPNSYSGGGQNISITLCNPSASFDSVCGYKPSEEYPFSNFPEELGFTVPASFLAASSFPVVVANTLLIHRDLTSTTTNSLTRSGSDVETPSISSSAPFTQSPSQSISTSYTSTCVDSITTSATKTHQPTISCSRSPTKSLSLTTTESNHCTVSPSCSLSAIPTHSVSHSVSCTSLSQSLISQSKSGSPSSSPTKGWTTSISPSVSWSESSQSLSWSTSWTLSPSVSSSKSNTRSLSDSHSCSLSHTHRGTPTLSHSQTMSPTSSSTASGTTVSVTSTPTQSATISKTSSQSIRPTVSCSSSLTSSQSPSQSCSSFTPTPTHSNTRTNSRSSSATISAVSSLSRSFSPSATPSRSKSSSGTRNKTPTRSVSASSATSTPSTTALQSTTDSATHTGSASSSLSCSFSSMSTSGSSSSSASNSLSRGSFSLSHSCSTSASLTSVSTSPSGTVTHSYSAASRTSSNSHSISHSGSSSSTPSFSASKSLSTSQSGSTTGTGSETHTSASLSGTRTHTSSKTASVTITTSPSPNKSWTSSQTASHTPSQSTSRSGTPSPQPSGSPSFSPTQSASGTKPRTSSDSASKSPTRNSHTLSHSTRTTSCTHSLSDTPTTSIASSSSGTSSTTKSRTLSCSKSWSPSTSTNPSKSSSQSDTRSLSGSTSYTTLTAPMTRSNSKSASSSSTASTTCCETPSKSPTVSVSISQSSPSTSFTRSQSFPNTLTSSSIPSQSQSRSHTSSLSAALTVSASVSQSRSRTAVPSLSPSTTQSESTSCAFSMTASLSHTGSDSQGLTTSKTDSRSATASYDHTLSCSTALSDTPSGTRSTYRSTSCTPGPSISASSSATNSRSLSSSLSITFSGSPSALQTSSRTLHVKTASFSKTVTGSISALPSVSATAARSLTRSLSRSQTLIAAASITSTPTPSKTTRPTPSETLGMTETGTLTLSATIARHTATQFTPTLTEEAHPTVSNYSMSQTHVSTPSPVATASTFSISATGTESSTESQEPTPTDSAACSIGIYTVPQIAANPVRAIPVSATAEAYPTTRCTQPLSYSWDCFVRESPTAASEPCALEAVSSRPGIAMPEVTVIKNKTSTWKGQGFTLVAFALSPFIHAVDLRLQVYQEDLPAPVAAVARAWVQVRPTLQPLVVRIVGGSRYVFFNAPWKLASELFDPSQYPSFSYTYEWAACRVEGPSPYPDDVACTDLLLPPIPWMTLAGATPVLEMGSTLVLGGTSWKVSLTISHSASGRSTTAAAIITFATYVPPDIGILGSIISDGGTTSPSVLRAVLLDNTSNTLSVGYSSYTFLWTSPDLDLDGVALGGVDRPELALKVGALVGVPRLKVVLKLFDNSTGKLQQTVTKSIIVNTAPVIVNASQPIITQRPVLGVEAGRTYLSIIVDPDQFSDRDTPLSYRLSFEHNGVEYPILPNTSQPTTYWRNLTHYPTPQTSFVVPVLPNPPEAGIQYIRIITYVRDIFNATSRFAAPYLSPVIQDPTEWTSITISAFGLNSAKSTVVTPANILSAALLLPFSLNLSEPLTGVAERKRASAARSRRRVQPLVQNEYSTQVAPALLHYLKAVAPPATEITLPVYAKVLRFAADPAYNPAVNVSQALEVALSYSLIQAASERETALSIAGALSALAPRATSTVDSLVLFNAAQQLALTTAQSMAMGQVAVVNATVARIAIVRDSSYRINTTFTTAVEAGFPWWLRTVDELHQSNVPDGVALSLVSVLLQPAQLFATAVGVTPTSGLGYVRLYREPSPKNTTLVAAPNNASVTFRLPYPSGNSDATCVRLYQTSDSRWVWLEVGTFIAADEILCYSSVDGAVVGASINLRGAAPDAKKTLAAVAIFFIVFVIVACVVLVVLLWYWQKKRKQNKPSVLKSSIKHVEPATPDAPPHNGDGLPANPILAFMKESPIVGEPETPHLAYNPLATFFGIGDTPKVVEYDSEVVSPRAVEVYDPTTKAKKMHFDDTDSTTWAFVPPNVPSVADERDKENIVNWLHLIKEHQLKDLPELLDSTSESPRPARRPLPHTQNPLAPFLTTADEPECVASAQSKLTSLKGRLGIKATVLDGQLKVMHVRPNGPAAKAGVRMYDHILALDFTPVSDDLDIFQSISNRFRPGQLVPLLLSRKGREVAVDVTVGTTITRADFSRLQRIARGDLMEGDVEWVRDLDTQNTSSLYPW
eukprot:TRINITY_DN15430_c0_g1_i1.p1 TRINITY_DN15430_c0_g1~~TRINITY_DN15430_c0_g1_i1.p1  ORF type:complete len:2548 (-),score=177.65 TRINITY_DN15430_c0_g1_i1:65-6646(-)